MLIWVSVKWNTAVYYSVNSHVRALCHDKFTELQKGTHKLIELQKDTHKFIELQKGTHKNGSKRKTKIKL